MKNLFLLLSLTVFSLASAQINFEKGYFIKKTGEKVSCYIKNMDWKDNPTEFEYKSNTTESNAAKESIFSVTEFGIDNKCKYVNQNVNIDRSSSNISNLKNVNLQLPLSNETLFLKVLIEGDVNLYSYSDGDLTRYFIKTKNAPIEQLVHNYSLTPNIYGENNIVENNNFRQQLLNSLQSDKLNQSDFEYIKYDKSSLTKIVTKYNNSKSNSSVSFESKSKTKNLMLKFTPAINLTTVKLEDPYTDFNLNATLDSKLVLNIGMEMEYTLPYNNRKWSFFINPAYQKYSAEQVFVKNNGLSVQSGANADFEYKVSLDYYCIEIPVGIRHYFYINPSSKIFINGALAYNIGKANVYLSKKSNLLNSSTTYNLLFGVGYNFKNRYSVEFRINNTKQITSEYKEWNTKYSSLGLVLGYRFL